MCVLTSVLQCSSKIYENKLQRMNKKGDHRLRNSAQYERVLELLIMHKAKWTPRQIPLLPWTDGNNGICLGVHFALRTSYVFQLCRKSVPEEC